MATRAQREAARLRRLAEQENICRRRDCVFHPRTVNKGSCNYIIVTGHRRGCPVKNCSRYQTETGPKNIRTKVASFEKTEAPDADVALNADLIRSLEPA